MNVSEASGNFVDIDYVYDDREDYYSNIDYTSDVTFGKWKIPYIYVYIYIYIYTL